MEEGRNAFKILTGTPAENRRRWEDTIRMDLKQNGFQYEELGWSAQDWGY